MKGHLSYTALLDAIGFAVEQGGGADVLVHELPEHVLVSFVTPTEQQVVRWTRAEIVALHATATTADAEARTRQGALARFQGRRRTPDPASLTLISCQGGEKRPDGGHRQEQKRDRALREK